MDYEKLRDWMVSYQIEARGVRSEAVLSAMRRIERHLFVPEQERDQAYEDHPLSIGEGQTISQPYMVACMTEMLRLKPGDRVLEIGTGCGYQTAVLAEVAAEVFSVEIVESLAESARKRLGKMGYDRVHVKAADGSFGWAEHAPYDGILVAAAAPKMPQSLIEQLKVGGKMVLPLGNWEQYLIEVTKTDADHYLKRVHFGVRFVPLMGAVRESY